MFFETDRLFTRELALEDISVFNEMQKNINVMKYIIGRAKTEEENIRELQKIINSYKNLNSDFLVMAVVRKSDNQFIGTCAIVKNEDDEHEIGYRFLQKYWGNGFGKEILEGLIEYSLTYMNLGKIVAYVYAVNGASVKILDNSQMNFVREYYDNDWGYIVRYYRLSKSDR